MLYIWMVYRIMILLHKILFLPSSGQTLALAEPEARLYNHQPDPPTRQEQMFVLAISQPFLNGLS